MTEKHKLSTSENAEWNSQEAHEGCGRESGRSKIVYFQGGMEFWKSMCILYKNIP